jgi:Rod binding domain-containing protein
MMKIGPLTPTSTFGLGSDAATKETQAKDALAKVQGTAGKIDGQNALDPEKLRLAREFEQIFIRKMLASLEKSGHKEGASGTSGNGVYGSMVVNALAEAVSKGGGVGLAEVIARAASQPVSGAGPATPSKAELETAVANATRASHTAPHLGMGLARVSAPESASVTASPATTTTYRRPAATIKVNEDK